LKLRVLTGIVIGILTLLVLLVFPAGLSSAVFAAICLGALVEFVTMVKLVLPSAPLRALYLLVPALAGLGFYYLHHAPAPLSTLQLLCLLTAVLMAVVSSVLFGSPKMADAIGALGVLAYAIPYFVLPQVAYFYLIEHDRWLLLLLVAVVAMSDTFAYFIGRAWGRHKLAPVISPNKSWEGAAAGFLASLLAAALFSYWRHELVDPRYLALAAATNLAGQMGDLVESVIKRGAGVKDSSGLLPGHGGLYDRIDALLVAAPVFVAAWWLLGFAPGA
jgi:phosphatidate cytidylyltransferase